VVVEDGRLIGVEPPASERWKAHILGCPRSRAGPEFVYHPDRLNYPLKRVGQRGENNWQQIGWEQALDDIADRLIETRNVYGPEGLAIGGGGDSYFAEEYRVRFQSLYGTPNFVSHAAICGSASYQISHLLCGSIIYFPYLTRETRCVLLLGTNPATALGYFWRTIRDAREHGLKLIVVDPRRTQPAMAADLWLQPRPGTDAALLLGMANTIIEEELYDKDFVTRWCHGFDQLAERVKDYTPERVAEITWVPADKIREAVRLYALAKPALTYHMMGIEEQPNASQAIHARYVLNALAGNIDIPGGDLLNEPHPQARLAGDLELLDMMSPEQQDKMIGKEFHLCSWPVFHKIRENVGKVIPRPLSSYWISGFAHSPSVFRAMITGQPYPVKAMINQAHNPLLNYANTKLVYEALKKLDLNVVMDVFMTPTCQLADYVLPAAGCMEKPVLMGADYYLRLQGGDAAIEPLYERKPEYYFWRELGLRLGQVDHWPWKTQEEAYDYRLAPMGLTFREFMDKGGFDSPRHRYRKYEESGFGTPTGKFELYSTILEGLGYDPLPSYEEPPQSPIRTPELAKEYPLILITGSRNFRYFHSQGRQIESIRKRSPDPLAEISRSRADELGIGDGDWIWIETPVGRSKLKCQCSDSILRDVVSAEHGWWFPEDSGQEPSLHGLWKSNINVVLDDDPDASDAASGTWVLRGQLCKVYKAQE